MSAERVKQKKNLQVHGHHTTPWSRRDVGGTQGLPLSMQNYR